MLGEFAYEEIIEPERRPGDGRLYSLTLDDGTELRFTARRGVYGSWRVDPDSIGTAHPPADPLSNGASSHHASAGHHASADGAQDGTLRPFRDPLRFLTRARSLLGLDGATLGHLIRELTLTLTADARLDHTALTAAELADVGYAELEGHQTGHPWLVASKGRLGFSAADAARFTPETRTPLRLPWIAVSTRIAQYRGVGRLTTPEHLYAGELDPAVRAAFAAELETRGLDPESYLYLPVHPWQWDEWIVPLFAPAIADGDIVALHTDGDARLPQQSVRTFANVSRPDRHTVKLPLSILNTLVWRGLPTERTLAAPPSPPGSRACARTTRSCATPAGSSSWARSPPSPWSTRSTTTSPKPRTSTRKSSARSGGSPCHPASPRANAPVRSPPSSIRTRRAARSPPSWSSAPASPRRPGSPASSPPCSRPPALPLPLRHGLLPARRERHRRLRRERRPRPPRDQGLRRRRQHQRPPAAGARHHARRGA